MMSNARMDKWKTLLSEAGAHERAGRIDAACLASNIVGQRSTLLHVRSHWRMLHLRYVSANAGRRSVKLHDCSPP